MLHQRVAALKEESGFLDVNGLSMTFQGADGVLEALCDVSFSLGKREFVCVLGPSGSGKSTLLRILAGLVRPVEGDFHFHCVDSEPSVSIVFQQANLMPWRTVLQNILLPLELRGVEPETAQIRAAEMIRMIGLEDFSAAWPSELSGGMAQRVAIARAFIAEPDLLLLDEPFGALDALTRERMGDELLKLWESKQTAVLMVTHSIPEALLLSDRVIVLSPRPGRIVAEVEVTLPRPRDEETRYSPDFIRLEKELRQAIR